MMCDYHVKGKCINENYNKLRHHYKNNKHECFFKMNQDKCPFSD